MMQNKKTLWAGLLMLVFAQISIGVGIVTSKALIAHIQPLMLLMLRLTISFIGLLLVHLFRSGTLWQPLVKITPKQWRIIVLQGLCAGALFNILIFMGLQYTSASLAGMITSALPAIVVIFSIIFLKEKITKATAICVILAIAGLILMNISGLSLGGHHQFIGDLIVFLALLPEAFYYILAKLYHNTLPLFLASALLNGINIPFIFLLLLTHPSDFVMHINLNMGLLVFISGMSSALFYVFWLKGCNSVQGSLTGLTTAFMPISTVLIAYLFLNETIGALQALGIVLILLSIAVNTLRSTQKPHIT